MRISPCGVGRAKVSLSERAVKFVNTTLYVPKAAWTETEFGTLTIHGAENARYSVDIREGCFGRSTHVTDRERNSTTHQSYLFKDASLNDLKEKIEKEFLLPT